MILAPVQIKTDDERVIDGALLDVDGLTKVIALIDGSNADGLKGEDATLLMHLKEAHKDLCDLIAAAENSNM